MLQDTLRRAKRIPSHLRRRGFKRVAVSIGLTISDGIRFWVWDVWHRVETRKQVPLEKLGIEGSCYGPTPQDFLYFGWNGDYCCSSAKFPSLLRRLNLDWSSFTYLDIGAGKGKTLLMAAELPFAKVVGVEISEKLVEVARKNLSRHRNFTLKCKNIEILLQDASTYEFPPVPLVIYSLNTFPPPIMKVVLENLKRSVEENPRDVYFISNPAPPPIEQLFKESGRFALVDSTRGPESFVGHQTYRSILAPVQPQSFSSK